MHLILCSLETRECRTRAQRSRTIVVWSQKEFLWMGGMTMFKTPPSSFFSTVVFHSSLLYPVISNPKSLMLVKVITTDFLVNGLARLLEGNIRSCLDREGLRELWIGSVTLVTILSRLHPSCNMTTCFLKGYLNVILPLPVVSQLTKPNLYDYLLSLDPSHMFCLS
jgi:hypothetical protein